MFVQERNKWDDGMCFLEDLLIIKTSEELIKEIAPW